MLSTARDSAICGTLALSVALGLRQNKTRTVATNNGPSSVSSSDWLSLALLGVGSWCLLKAIGNVKIGVTRKLGIPLNNDNHQGLCKRRLGFLERWYVAHSRSGQHTGFMIALDLEARSSDHYPTLIEIRKILQRVCRKFPWLRVKVKRDGVTGIDSRDSLLPPAPATTEKPGTKDDVKSLKGAAIWGDDLYLEVQDANTSSSNVELFGLREVVLSENAEYMETFEQILEEEGRIEWHDEDPTAPMWRVTLLRSGKRKSAETFNKFSLILSFHHLITDGMGSTAIAQAILDESGGDPKDEVDNFPQNLSPPMEDLMDTVPTLQHILLPVLLDRCPSLTPYFKPPHWQGLTIHKDEKRQCQLVCCPISLNGEQLTESCQKMDITVNSLCIATLSKAIAKILAKKAEHNSSAMTTGRDSTTVRLKVQVAKSERNNCNLSPAKQGAYVSGPQIYVSASSDESQEWQSIGKSFQQKLRASYRSAAMDMGLCPFISEDWIHFAKKFAKGEPNGISDSIEYSNLGKVRLHGSTNWVVKDFWFAQCRKDTGPGIICLLARTGPLGENIRAVLSAFPQTAPKSLLKEIAQAWEQEMELAIHS